MTSDPIKILHLYSNHKWTGPADHALNLVGQLSRQKGLMPFFACGRRIGSQNPLHRKARQRDLRLVSGFLLSKHLNWRTMPDVVRLRLQMKRGRYDLIHSHQDNDMLTAALAGFGANTVRTVYAGEPWALTRRQRYGLSRASYIMTASSRVRDYLAGIFPNKPIRHLHIPVDPNRFFPRSKKTQLLAEFNLKPASPVGGIVARVQRHRRFDLLLQAIGIVAGAIPDFKFLIIGRGTHLDELARRPVAEMGLANTVTFTGYRGEDYADVLNLLDFKVFLTPGSDGACRAVREALACAKPVVAARRGILPELIEDGRTGRLVDESPESLAGAMISLCRNQSLRREWAENAHQFACRQLNPEMHGRAVGECYRDLMKGGGGNLPTVSNR